MLPVNQQPQCSRLPIHNPQVDSAYAERGGNCSLSLGNAAYSSIPKIVASARAGASPSPR